MITCRLDFGTPAQTAYGQKTEPIAGTSRRPTVQMLLRQCLTP
jgi:hypothetical protein